MSKVEIFQLHRERCKLVHLNLRSELHGEEHANAIDLKFEFDSANNLLAKLHPDLRDTFYTHGQQADIDADFKPKLRFPLLDPKVKWELEIPRTLLRLHAEGSDIVLGGGKTNNFQLVLKEGGTVSWAFRVQFSKPDPSAIAALSSLLQTVVPVSLECRGQDEEEEQGGGDLFAQVEKQTQAPKSEARQKAEAMFDTPGAQVDQLPAGGETVFANDGVQPGDAGHSYTAQPDDDVVDAEYVPPADNVQPIGTRKRRTAKTGTGGNLE